jgi:hypothetical protein
MANWGTQLWGLSPTPGVPLPGCDALNALNDVWFRLGFMSTDDMSVDDRWVTIDDLYSYVDEEARRLAYSLGLFMAYDASVAVAAGTPSLPLPSHHVFTVFAWLVYPDAPLRALRLTGVAQLFALDAQWAIAEGPPARLSLDAAEAGTAVLYPSPVVPAVLAQVRQESPAPVREGASALPLSPVMQDWMSYAMLAQALDHESDHMRPEVAAHCRERMKLYEKIAESYWGPGQ